MKLLKSVVKLGSSSVSQRSLDYCLQCIKLKRSQNQLQCPFIALCPISSQISFSITVAHVAHMKLIISITHVLCQIDANNAAMSGVSFHTSILYQYNIWLTEYLFILIRSISFNKKKLEQYGIALH